MTLAQEALNKIMYPRNAKDSSLFLHLISSIFIYSAFFQSTYILHSFSHYQTLKTSYKAPADFTPSDTSGLSVGMKVEHPKFGYGNVTGIDESGPNRKARVYFDDFGEKTLLLSFAKLRIHTN